MADTGRVWVTVRVRNVGERAGDEVVQLYVSDVEASVPVPRLHLEGFTRVHLEPRERTDVRFELKPAQLAAWRDDGTAFLEPGQFAISVGGGQPSDQDSGALTAMLTVGG
jgi:beta-glucosidase